MNLNDWMERSGTSDQDQGKLKNKFLIKGKYEVISHDTVRITELPIGVWTSPYKAFLETLMDEMIEHWLKIYDDEPVYKYD